MVQKTIAEDDVAHDHIITKDNIECIKSVLSNEISKVEDANISNEFTQDWSEATKNVKENEEVQSCNDINLQNINTLTMWLWDVWEDNYKKPGHLFLFGRAEINGTFTSVCVQITNVEHCLYLLPRAKVKFRISKACFCLNSDHLFFIAFDNPKRYCNGRCL